MTRSVVDVLEELEATAGSNAKRDILEAAKDSELLKRVFAAAQDPYTVYYVNKFKVPRPTKGSSGDDDTRVRVFIDMITDWLATRKVTGNEAKDMVVALFTGMDERQQKWCQRILLHNLRCGVQETTTNKVWPGLINSFSVALASTLKSEFVKGTGIRILEPVTYPVRAEPKLDGLRCIAVKKDGAVTFYTRNGTVLETLPKIKWVLEDARYDNVVLDGEAMGGDWNESASVLMSSKSRKDDERIVFHVFDAMSLDDWVNKVASVAYSERIRLVSDVVALCNARVRQVPHVMAKDEEELKAFFARCMDDGFEGIMLKDLGATYEWDRSRNILKLKPCATYEGTVIGWYEGRRGTKREGLFGGFEVLLANGVVTRVGGGFSDALRAQVQLSTPESWTGHVVECEAQPDPLTSDGLTADGRMRFPVYVRERASADVDAAVTDAYVAWRARQAS